MIYLIKNLSTVYTIVVSSLSELPSDGIYSIYLDKFYVNDILFANIIHMPTELSTQENMISVVDTLYQYNREEILVRNKSKFIIAVIQFKSDRSKDVLYTNSYLNLLSNATDYNKLLSNSPMHHYEILNYKTEKFEVYIKKEDAINKLNQYMNEFIVDYKSNIVKEFSTKEEFLTYINL